MGWKRQSKIIYQVIIFFKNDSKDIFIWKKAKKICHQQTYTIENKDFKLK